MAPWKLRQLHHQSCHHAITSSTQFRWVTYTPPNDPSFHHFIIIVSGWKDVDISPTWVTWNTVASCVPNLKTPKVLDEVAMAIIHPDCKHLQSGFATCPALTSLKIAFFSQPFWSYWKMMFERPPPERDRSFPSHFISIKGLVEIPCIWAIIVRQFRSVILRIGEPMRTYSRARVSTPERDYGRHEINTFHTSTCSKCQWKFLKTKDPDMGAQEILWKHQAGGKIHWHCFHLEAAGFFLQHLLFCFARIFTTSAKDIHADLGQFKRWLRSWKRG